MTVKAKFYCTTHVFSSSHRCRVNENLSKEECVRTLRKSRRFTVIFYHGLWAMRSPAAIIRLACLTRYDQESPALKCNSQSMWEAAAHGLFRQRCVSLSLTSSRWRILRIVCVCVSVRKEEKKKMGERESVGQNADVAVWECVKPRREFMRWHLISCLTFPVSQGSSFKNNAEEKPPTTNNWNATKKGEKKSRCLLVTELLLLLETGDRENVWVTALCL